MTFSALSAFNLVAFHDCALYFCAAVSVTSVSNLLLRSDAMGEKIRNACTLHMCLEMSANGKKYISMGSGFHACMVRFFFKGQGQGHQGIFSLVKSTLRGSCKFLLEHFESTEAMTRGHRGKLLCCLHEVPGLGFEYMLLGCQFEKQRYRFDQEVHCTLALIAL